MFMIFHLRRQDVMAPGDLGVRNGLTTFFGLPKKSLEGVKQQDRIFDLTKSWRYVVDPSNRTQNLYRPHAQPVHLFTPTFCAFMDIRLILHVDFAYFWDSLSAFHCIPFLFHFIPLLLRINASDLTHLLDAV